MRETIKSLSEELDDSPLSVEPLPMMKSGSGGLSNEVWDYIERRAEANEKAAQRRARETPEQRAKRLAYHKRWRERRKQANANEVA